MICSFFLSRLRFSHLAIYLLFSTASIPSLTRGEIRPLGHFYANFGYGSQVSVFNHTAFIADHFGGIACVNIVNPLQPQVVNYIPGIASSYGTVSRYSVSGNYLYVISSSDFIQIYNISNVLAWQLTGTIAGRNISDFSVSGNLIAVQTDSANCIFDISNRAQPRYLSSVRTYGLRVKLQGNYVATLGPREIIVHSLANPSTPVQILNYLFPTGLSTEYMAFNGRYLFVKTHQGFNTNSLYCYDVMHSPAPVLIANCTIPDGQIFGVWSNNNQFFAAYYGELKIYNADSTLDSLIYNGSKMVDGEVSDMTWDGTMACVLDYDGLLMLSGYRTIHRFYEPGAMQYPVVHNGYCYIPNQEGGLLISQIGSDGLPHIVATFNPSAELCPVDIAFKGDTAFVLNSCGMNGYVQNASLLYSIDLSQPTVPRILDSIPIDLNWSVPQKIRIQGNRAFIHLDWSDSDLDESWSWLEAVDISNAYNMHLLNFPSSWCNYDFDVDSNYVYFLGEINTTWSHMSILDCTNIDTPRVVGRNVEYAVSGITVHGNRSYIGGDNQLYIVNISNPANPVTLDTINTTFARTDEFRWADNCLITRVWNYYGGTNTLMFWDVHDPNNVCCRDSLPNLSFNSFCSVDNNRLLVASPNVFSVYDISSALSVKGFVQSNMPSNYSLLNYPNPFNSTTTIRYSLPQAGDVRIDLYNMLGQRVTALVRGQRNAGEYSLSMNGAKLSSGEYIVRMMVGNKSLQQRKITLVK